MMYHSRNEMMCHSRNEMMYHSRNEMMCHSRNEMMYHSRNEMQIIMSHFHASKIGPLLGHSHVLSVIYINTDKPWHFLRYHYSHQTSWFCLDEVHFLESQSILTYWIENSRFCYFALIFLMFHKKLLQNRGSEVTLSQQLYIS